MLKITPAATLFAFHGGRHAGPARGLFRPASWTPRSPSSPTSRWPSPVILLFFLLVDPGNRRGRRAAIHVEWCCSSFPIIFFVVLFNSRYHTQAPKRNLLVAAVLVIGLFWAYLSLISNADDPDLPLIFRLWPKPLDLFDIQGNILIVFVSVVFVNSPTVFRIVRGHRARHQDAGLLAAGQTRGWLEGPWYIMPCGRSCQTPPGAAHRPISAEDRLHHDPSGNARLLRPRRQPGKPGLGLDDQRGPQAC